jgi:hypothetical protein
MTKVQVIIRRPPERKRTRDINKYAKEIGSIAILWNQLHDDLANILGFLLPSKNPHDFIAQAMWYSTTSDHAQRKMLRAAISAHSGVEPEAKKKLTWLLDKVDNFLADKRNDAFHTPFITAVSDDTLSHLLIANHLFTQSPRAKKLRDKDLLKEFKWYANYTSALAMYAKQLERALIAGKPLPDKPDLPHLGQRWIGRAIRPKNTRKPRQPPPRS